MRPDVLKFLDDFNVDFHARTKTYLLKRRYWIPKLRALFKKVDTINDRVLREQIFDVRVLRQLLTPKETLLLAKVGRETTEMSVNWFQKTHPYSSDLTFQPIRIGQVPAEWQVPKGAPEDVQRRYRSTCSPVG